MTKVLMLLILSLAAQFAVAEGHGEKTQPSLGNGYHR
jgi:hypothetical protein